jgi:hypothetical protein
VFPARYELNSYIVFRKRLVSKRLSTGTILLLLSQELRSKCKANVIFTVRRATAQTVSRSIPTAAARV